MKDFFKYYGKTVKLIHKDLGELFGKIVDYEPSGDSDDFQVHLGLRTKDRDYDLDISESEIVSIIILE